MIKKVDFSQKLSVFHERYLPEEKVVLAGYAALIKAYQLRVPLPDTLSAISHKHKRYVKAGWEMFTPRHQPESSLYGHLVFALKYEGVDLGILKALFEKIADSDIEEIVKAEPTGSYSRRIWFLYEWLLDKTVRLADAKTGARVDVLDTRLQYSGPSQAVRRQLVNNNLPGVRNFCPTIRKTEKLDKFIEMQLGSQVGAVLGDTHKDILMRAAAFMLLKDSKASYAIEGETPPQNRAERWAQTIGQAGLHVLSQDEFYRLQKLIIADFRFTHFGYREEGGFIGEHERSTGMPIPDHISAKHQDIKKLMEGLIQTDKLLKESDLDPVLAATMIAFGFLFIHPFEDGNGRIHRYLIHHVLAEKGFTNKNIIFPVSAVILERLLEYREVLEAYSKPRLDFISWEATDKGNVKVNNNTIDLYRYFDATKQAEFLYDCIRETIDNTLPKEVEFLQNYDELKQFICQHFEMPDRVVNLLIRFLYQGNGRLSDRAKNKEFSSLTQHEVAMLERKYKQIFV